MQTDNTKWTDLLREAVSKPGLISQAYSSFHGYSIGNQILALVQCQMRRLQPGPIATYVSWQVKGRQVRRGEKAITLCMPITVKARAKADGEADQCFTRFVYKPYWFVLSQTNGEPVEMPTTPEWIKERALEALGIQEIEFTELDGNVMGYAKGREIAISPINPMLWKTLFHECAHILCGHTAEGAFADGEQTPRNLREVEAESVALLCCESLGLPGAEYSRGYIQGWLGQDVIPEKSAQKIFHAADQILRAGQAAEVKG